MEGFEDPMNKRVLLSQNNTVAYRSRTNGSAIIFTKRVLRSGEVLSFTLLEKEPNYSDYITSNLQMEIGLILSTASSAEGAEPSKLFRELKSLSEVDKDTCYVLVGELYSNFLKVMVTGDSIGLMVQDESLFTFINGVNVERITSPWFRGTRTYKGVVNIAGRNRKIKTEKISTTDLFAKKFICLKTTMFEAKFSPTELKFGTIVQVICYPKCCNVKAVETAWVKVDENVHAYEYEGQVKTTCLEPVTEGINSSILNDAVQSSVEKHLGSDYSIIRILCVGPPGVGKTCLKYVLQGKSAPKRYQSTNVQGETTRVIRHSSFSSESESSDWVDLTFDKLVEQLASVTVQHLQHEGFNVEESLPELGDSNCPINKAEEGMPEEKVKILSEQSVHDQRARVEETSILCNLKNYVSYETELCNESNAAEREREFEHIFFTDCGGQPQFLEVLPAFIKGGTVIMVVIKLSEGLHKIPSFSFHVDDKDKSIPGSYTQLTNLEMIESVACSVSAYKTDESHETKPYLLIVATHIDKVHFSSDTSKLNALNKTLDGTLESIRENCIEYDELSRSIAFPINAINDKANMASKIRESIKRKVIGCKIKIPICWHMFEVNVKAYCEKKERRVLSLDECIQIGSNKDVCVPEEKIREVLVHYDRLNLYHYFPSVLPNFIITDMQLLPELVSNLLKVSFVKTQFLPQGVPPGSQLKLKNEGLFTKPVLEACIKFSLQNEKEIGFDIEQIIILLRHLSIIGKVSNDEYFMPSALEICGETKLNNLKQKYLLHFDPLLFLPKMKLIPQGFFTSLVVHCLNKKNNTFTSNPSTQQYRNTVSLKYLNGVGSVLLICRKHWIELCYSGENPNDAYHIQETIYKSFSTVCEVLPYDYSKFEFSYGFLCVLPKSKEHNDPLQHACELTSSQILSVTCLQDHIGTSTIHEDRRKSSWLSNSNQFPEVHVKNDSSEFQAENKAEQITAETIEHMHDKEERAIKHLQLERQKGLHQKRGLDFDKQQAQLRQEKEKAERIQKEFENLEILLRQKQEQYQQVMNDLEEEKKMHQRTKEEFSKFKNFVEQKHQGFENFTSDCFEGYSSGLKSMGNGKQNMGGAISEQEKKDEYSNIENQCDHENLLQTEKKQHQNQEKDFERLQALFREEQENHQRSLKKYKDHKILLEQARKEHQCLKEYFEKLKLEKAQIENSWTISYTSIQETEEELGRGGWGAIKVGIFREQRVAVKELYKSIVSDSTLAVIHREISTMSRLRHPNLLLFIGAVLDHPSGNPLIITEIMDTSLRQAYEKGQLMDKETKLLILRDTAAGLNYLHCHPDEIIHRDVSSANVLLESRGLNKWRAKLSDFGSANIACNAFTQAPGAAVYSAPESIVTLVDTEITDKSQSTKMDVYSYGVLMCEVITCMFPDNEKFCKMLQSVSTMFPDFGDLIKNCMEKSPQDRPTMKQVIQQIDKHTNQH